MWLGCWLVSTRGWLEVAWDGMRMGARSGIVPPRTLCTDLPNRWGDMARPGRVQVASGWLVRFSSTGGGANQGVKLSGVRMYQPVALYVCRCGFQLPP